jgi:hypothetical protein
LTPENDNNYNVIQAAIKPAGRDRMEHLLVIFPVSRTVLIDGEESGMTNTVLRVEEGTHTLSLGEPKDYKPASRIVTIKGTSPIKPRKVTFVEKP